MGGSGVIDQFLSIFTIYIDSGFSLLVGDVWFLSSTLITLAGLFWALAGEQDVIARLIKKTPTRLRSGQVIQPSLSSATRLIVNYLDGTFFHW